MARIRSRARPRGRTLLLVLASAVLLAAGGTGVWLWSAGGNAARDEARYCWDAWHADDEVWTDDSHRTAKESPPSRARPKGSCTLTQRWKFEGRTTVETVEARYGTLAGDPAERRDQLARFLTPDAVPLPRSDGLTGFVQDTSALLVLPASCDREGLPSTVVLEGSTREPDGSVGHGLPTGSGWKSARLLVSAANSAMERTGCAPARPLRLRAPLPSHDAYGGRSSGDSVHGVDGYPQRLCGIEGLGPKKRRNAPEYAPGLYSDTLLACAVESHDGDSLAGLRAVHAPRLVALFKGLPESDGKSGDWALRRSTCETGENGTGGGRMVTFVRGAAKKAGRTDVEDPARTLPLYEHAAARHFGCGQPHEGSRG